MKTLYTKKIVLFTAAVLSFAEIGWGQNNPSHGGGYVENKNESVLRMDPQPAIYTTDKIVKNDPTTNQRNARVTVAFNGWIYAGFTTSSGGSGGITVRRSKDGGLTWSDFYVVSFPSTDFPSFDMVVCGTDTNNLFLFTTGINHNTSSNTYVAWADRFNATTGAFIAEPFNESNGSSKIYDIAIASDYKYPSYLSSPFSVAVLFSETSGPSDSMICVVSVDGGVSFTSRKIVSTTGQWYRKVAIAYGIGASYSNGRYFIAYEQRASSTAEKGHILFTHTTSNVQDNFNTPIYIDSADASMANICRSPSICMMEGTTDNDSASLTAVVVVDRQYSVTDHDILGLYAKKSVNTSKTHWSRFDIDNSVNYDIQPNVSWDPAYGNFLVTYFDSTTGKLPYVVHQCNMINPNTWALISTQYNDLTTGLIAAWPKVQINPVFTQAAFVWNKEGVSNNGVTLFDAEYLPSGISPVLTANQIELGQPYPNPAYDQATISFELEQAENITLALYDLSGKEISVLANGNQDAGKHIIAVNLDNIPAGCYFYELTASSTKITKKLVVVH